MPGMRVRVPFGSSALTGYIVAVTPQPETGGKPARIRTVTARLDETPSVSPDLLALTEWAAERYLAPLGQCLRLAFPGAPEQTRSTRRTQHTDEIFSVAAKPVSDQSPFSVQRATLNEELAPLRKRVLDAIAGHVHESVLVPAATHALVGFYGEAIQATLDRGRTALVLVPEAAGVEAAQAFFTARWGERCQPYHGALPPGDRRRAWARIQQGEAAVILGTRSAVFAPLSGMGLIVIDQEDHPAYKAENIPRYDARVIAAERARRAGAVLVLASAHPSLETVHATGWDQDALALHSASANAPTITVVDLRDVPSWEILSTPLIEAMETHLAVRKSVLLFLNRKGYASVLICRDCGHAMQCPACSVGWTFHKHAGMLRCGYCGRTGKAPETCPACTGTRLFQTGLGTEALEEAVRLRFPAARVARLERQRAGGDRANTAILSLWQAGELDILIGTQLVITRTPRPVASLVGLVHPDATLHLPDFHAAEQAYHTLSEVMTLADPHDSDAAIMLQTHIPQHHVIRALGQRDPSIFYENELAARKALGYPPFGRLIGLRVSGTRADLVEAAAIRWATLLRTAESSSQNKIEVLGPIPATPAKVRGRIRWQLVVKGADAIALRHTVRVTFADLEKAGKAGGLRYDIDVDPQSLM